MLKVNIIGIGPGNPDLLTGAARQAIAESNILIGDKECFLPLQKMKKCYIILLELLTLWRLQLKQILLKTLSQYWFPVM